MEQGKHKQHSYRKNVMQNAREIMPKTVVMNEPRRKSEECKENKEIIEKIQKKTDRTVRVTGLSSPKLNSVLQISNNIREIEESKRPQSHRRINRQSDVSRLEQATIDEKIAKQVNFPFDKQLYKELISLRLTERPHVPVTCWASNAHEPVKKDKEPVLSDFFVPPANQEHSVAVRYKTCPDGPEQRYDGLDLCRNLAIWTHQKP